MASIEIAPGWADAVQRYIEGLIVESLTSAEEATKVFHRAVQERARGDEQWTTLADDISLWNDEGQLVIGFTSPEFASQASLIEYGGDGESPNPLFRTLTSEVSNASQSMQRRLTGRYGPAMDSGAPRLRGMRYGR
jgi:hypothetical protein